MKNERKKEERPYDQDAVRRFCRLMADSMQVIYSHHGEKEDKRVIKVVSFDPLTIPEGMDHNFEAAKKIVFAKVRDILHEDMEEPDDIKKRLLVKVEEYFNSQERRSAL